jgi:hypothetical protein
MHWMPPREKLPFVKGNGSPDARRWLPRAILRRPLYIHTTRRLVTPIRSFWNPAVLVDRWATSESNKQSKGSIVPRFSSYVFLVSVALVSFAHAGDLRPDQKAAIEKVLATIDPSMREAVRPQVEQSIAYLSPAQVEMFLTGATAKNEAPEATPAEEEKRTATPEDLAYNRAQYEPVLRKHWQAKKGFDDFVDAELQAKCPNRDQYAVYREAERYELMELSPQWQRAADNQEAEVQVWGSTYVPQDGRYKFDFSKVKMTFNKETVSNAIAKACGDWAKEAAAFKQKAAAMMNSGDSGAAHKLEGTASSKVGPIAAALNAVLDAESPAGSYNMALLDALQNPKPIK